MSDILDMEFINSLPQPLMARKYGWQDFWMTVETICVETGCMRFDIMGKIERGHIDDIAEFKDMDGEVHVSDSFWLDS